jgi:hypothetical protein
VTQLVPAVVLRDTAVQLGGRRQEYRQVPILDLLGGYRAPYHLHHCLMVPVVQL